MEIQNSLVDCGSYSHVKQDMNFFLKCINIFLWPFTSSQIVNETLFRFSSLFIPVLFLVVFSGNLYAQTCKTPNLGATTVGETQSCDPINFGYILNNYADNDTITQYVIDFGDGETMTLSHNELNPAGVDTIYHSYAETSCTNTDRAYTFEIVAGENCATFPKQITIFPVVIGQPPQPGFAYEDPACAGEETLFTDTTVAGHNFDCTPAASYTWDFGDGTIVTTGEGGDQSHIYDSPGNYTVKLSIEQDCGIQTVQHDLTVVGPVASAFEIGDNTGSLVVDDCSDTPPVFTPDNICVPVAVPLKSLSSGEFMVQRWSVTPVTGALFSNDSSVSHQPDETIRFTAAGTYHITLVAENVCGPDTSCVEVIVQAPPTEENVRIEGIPENFCSPATIDVYTNVRNAISYNWRVSGVNGTADPDQPENADTWDPGPVVLTAGNYEFRLDLTNTCGSARVTEPVAVVRPFSAEIGQGDSAFCEGSSLVLSAVEVPGAEYQWQHNGDTIPGAILDSIEVDRAGDYTVVITLDNCAVTSDPAAVSVHLLPPAAIEPPEKQSFCDGEPVDVTLQANEGAGFSYQWQKDGTNIEHANESSLTVNEFGAYTVEVNDGMCSNTSDTVAITVGPTTETDFSFDSVQCQGVEVTFTNLTSEITGESVSFQWQFGDSTETVEGEHAVHIYSAPGIYPVTLTGRINSSGCENSETKNIEIVPAPVAGFTMTYVPQNLCGPLSVYFENNSAGENLQYRWDFGNGETSDDVDPPGITYEQGVVGDTAYMVMLQVQSPVSSCPVSAFTDTVMVKPSPRAQFLFAVDTICADYPLEINNYSVGSPESFTWHFGDQSPPLITDEKGTITHSFPYEGRTDTVYYVRLSAANACGADTLTRPVVVTTNIVEAFYNVDVNVGCAPLDVHFTSNQNGYNSIIWIWDDVPGNSTTGGTEQIYTYNAEGVYHPQLVVQNGCNVDTFSQAVTVYPLPVVSFEGPDGICVGQEAVFENTSPKPTGSVWRFTGTEDSVHVGSFPPPVVYETAGTESVLLTIVNPETGCRDEMVKTIDVYEMPVAAFVTPDNFCEGDTLIPQNNSVNASLYYWDFGQTGGIISGRAPRYVFNEAGVYDIRLKALNEIGCADSTERSINIQRQPQPRFTVSLTDTTHQSPVGAVVTNQTVFPSDSEGAFYWDFGNGETYEGFNVPFTIIYVNNTDVAQYMTITLEATTDVGCTAAYTQSVLVGATACDERITIPNIFTPNGDGLNDVLRPLILKDKDTYRPVVQEDGLKNYRMQVYNRWGELVFESTDVEKGWNGEGFAEGVYYCNVQFQCKSFDNGKLKSIEVTLKH